MAAYVSRQLVAAPDLPGLMRQVHEGLPALQESAAAAAISTVAEPAIERPMPLQIRKSIRNEALISFIDDKPHKASERHLTNTS